MSTAGSSFNINPSNYLGFENKIYKNALYKLAISKPSEFFTLRENVEKSIKVKIIKDMYDNIRTLLSEGRIGNSQIIMIDGYNVPPNFPDQKIVEINLGLAETLETALDEIINILIPLDFQSILQSKLTSQGNASIV